MAFVLLWVLLTFVGVPDNDQVQIQGLIALGGKPSPAAAGRACGAGDVVVSVDGKPIGGNVTSLTAAIQDHPGAPVTVVVDRDGHRQDADGDPGQRADGPRDGCVGPRRARRPSGSSA